MTASEVLRAALARSGVSKAAFCARAALSRALLDDYLRGAKQPSLNQLLRIVNASGLRLRIELDDEPAPVPPQFVAVLEFGETFPDRRRERRDPLVFPWQVWRTTP